MPDRPATPPVAAPCCSCGTTGGLVPRSQRIPWRGQGRCRRCYMRAYQKGLLTIDPSYLTTRRALPDIPALAPRTAADLGWPGTPVTDARLTEARVIGVGNTNASRAFRWLRAHGFAREDASAMVIWEPARLSEPPPSKARLTVEQVGQIHIEAWRRAEEQQRRSA